MEEEGGIEQGLELSFFVPVFKFSNWERETQKLNTLKS